MTKRILVLVLTLTIIAVGASAQRKTDKLDRGLVVVPHFASINYGNGTNGSQDGNLVSWRILPEEYYDVTYNVYRDGTKLNDAPLTISNFVDRNGSSSSQYQVSAVVKGVEQENCASAKPWTMLSDTYNQPYQKILLANVYDRDGQDVTEHYWANDAAFADLDGDGQLEMIVKRLNMADAEGVNTGRRDSKGHAIYNIYPRNSKEFVVIDAYNINWQTWEASLMWRIDCGPNMVSTNSTEINIMAFDWDQDGKAEVVLRGADNMRVYGSDGKTSYYTIGSPTVNTRPDWYNYRDDGTNIASLAYTYTGNEYLLYMNGETGAMYQQLEYPLKRLENGETDLNAAWGDGYGHRSSKYYFGAPYLDGHKPSIFLARGIYTRHKMITYNVGENHQLKQQWRWDCNSKGSQWFGQGFHNYVIADVDEDGRDEIVYGSMVIDDNGQGLHTTGFGHGDAQQVGDFDPYRGGLEIFACLENEPYWGNNYRNGTTGEVYFKYSTPETGGKKGDDGRCMMGKFRADIPGCIGTSSQMMNRNGTVISSVTNNEIAGSSGWLDATILNFRIYWDGDLLDEEYTGTGAKDAGSWAKIVKQSGPNGTGSGNTRLFTSGIGTTNNGSKNNPCFIGDILGDWREEIIMREGSDIVVMATPIESDYGFFSLWADHVYRQAMGTQMQVYNLPPHLSYFLGELEGYTLAPPPLTKEGRTVIGNNATITNSYNGQHLLHNEYDNTSLTVNGGIPDILTINVPTWVQGHDNNNNITTTTYTCTLSGALSGGTRLVKQGNGVLQIGSEVHTHRGKTDIWGGTVVFNGTMENSAVWMHRHTTLNTTDGHFNNGLTMEYGATLNIGSSSTGTMSSVEIAALTMNYGARVVLDVNGVGDDEHDWLNVSTLNIDDSKVGVATWEDYGPEHIAPVMELRMGTALGNGRYPIGHVGTVNGDLSKVKLVCNTIDSSYLSLIVRGGILYLKVSDDPTDDEITTNTPSLPFFVNGHGVVYDLQGRELHNGQVAKGIYILGNKKVMKCNGY